MSLSELTPELIARSLLSRLSAESLNSLAPFMRIIDVSVGEKLNREPQPQNVYIVLQGEIILRSRALEVDRIIAGRSIELKSLVTDAKQWQYDCFSEEKSKVLSIPWVELKKYLGQDPKYLPYLNRMTQCVELQKLNRDLKSFGLNSDVCREIILSLKPLPYAQIFSDWSEDLFLVVIDGEIELRVNIHGQRFPLAFFQAGDACLISLKNENLTVKAEPKGMGWVLRDSEWQALPVAQEFERFLTLFHGGARKAAKPIIESEKTILLSTEKTETKNTKSIQDYLKNLKASSLPGVSRSGNSQEPSVLQKMSDYVSSLMSAGFVVPRNSEEIGAASIINFARFYGYRLSMAEVKSIVSSTEGQGLAKISAAARRLGFNSRLETQQTLDSISQMSQPLLTFFNDNLVIVKKIRGSSVSLFNISDGVQRNVQVIDFDHGWSHEILALSPTANIHKGHGRSGSIWTYFRLLNYSSYKMLLVVLTGILSFLFSLVLPLVNQVVIDKVVLPKSDDMLWIILGITLILRFNAKLLDWVQGHLVAMINYDFEVRLNLAFTKRLLMLSQKFFNLQGRGDLVSRVENLKAIKDFLSQNIILGLPKLASIAASVLVLSLFHPWLSLVIFSLLPLQIIFVFIFSRLIEGIKVEVSKLESKDRSMMIEYFDNIDVIKSLNASVAARWRWYANRIEMSYLQVRQALFEGILNSFNKLCEYSLRIIILLTAAYLVVRGELSLGKVVSCSMLIQNVTQPLWALVKSFYELTQFKVTIDEVHPILDERAESVNFQAAAAEPFKGEITFENVNFSYETGDRKVIDNVSFKIRPGEVVAIIGQSGSGKSTLMSLLHQFHQCRGRILVDGMDIKSIPLQRLRSQVGFVEQEGHLFKGSLLENIGIGDQSPDLEKVMEVSNLADAHEFISKMPQAYNSLLEAGGVGLSEGQKQRVQIARVLYREPSILLLDEATSHLDAISEQRCLNRVLKRYKGKTVILVTQRINLVTRADRIFVLERGQLIEQGSHRELIDKQSRYYEYFCKQLSSL